MLFKATTIAPAGRYKYGNYYSSNNVTNHVTRSTYAGNTSNGGNEGGGNTGDSDTNKNYLLFLSKVSGAFNGMEIAIAPVTDSIDVIGYQGTERNATYVGDIQGDTPEGTLPPQDYSITGLTSGITVTVSNNGTTATTINVTFDSGLTESSGSLQIPCNVHMDNDPVLGDDIQQWECYRQECFSLVLEYTWSVSRSSSSSYVLELTNDSAGINCDSAGTIYAGAERPNCQAKLFYGIDRILSGVTYNIHVPSEQNVRGLSINSDGELIFNRGDATVPFSFSGMSLEITVSASLNGSVVASKIMTVSKSYPGKDGVSRTRWINLSADSAVYDPNVGSILPTAITATCMVQEGETAPREDTGTTIYYDFDTEHPSGIYTAPVVLTGSTISGYSYIVFALRENGVQYETETVSILKNGKNGAPGAPGEQGKQGAAVRGPVKWDNEVGRWFCSGKESSLYPDSSTFLDVMIKDGTYYYCDTTYYQASGARWADVSSNWIAAEQQFNFIATNLLLAENAKIDFLTGQGIYLGDKDGNIAAGFEGSTDDSDIVIWAGDTQDGTHLEDAPFKVYYDGHIEAKSGTFAGYVQMPYYFIGKLTRNRVLYNSTLGYLQFMQLDWKGNLSSAPEDPENYWGYHNTQYNRDYVYYIRSWYAMEDVTSQRALYKGYIADEHAYLIADENCGDYGMGDGGVLVLPEPSAALNGFTYHIIIEPNIATKAWGQNPGISLRTMNISQRLAVYAYASTVGSSHRLSFYGGHAEITCIPRGNMDNPTYYWCVTQCTGGVDCYDYDSTTGNFEYVETYTPVHGHSYENNYYAIAKIEADTTMPANKQSDTLYITRSE